MITLQTHIDKYTKLHTHQEKVLRQNEEIFTSFDGRQFLHKFPDLIAQIARHHQRAISVLDYGCGQATHTYDTNGTIFQQYKRVYQTYYCYDPAVPHFSTKPTPGTQFDCVVCADVMEHIPESLVPEVLTDIQSFCKPDGIQLFSISGVPASKSFLDGENLHCTVRTHEWWNTQLHTYAANCPTILIFYTPEGTHEYSAIHASSISYLLQDYFVVFN